MSSGKTVTLLATGALALGAVATLPAVAAPPPVAGITGFAMSEVPGCPYVQWRLARHDDGRITGRFWYSDLSGTSTAVGNIDQSGRFHTVLTSAIGKGPVGVVDGVRSPDGKVVADLKGQGCANYHSMSMAPSADINVGGEGGG
jgi:hypothetical protein